MQYVFYNTLHAPYFARYLAVIGKRIVASVPNSFTISQNDVNTLLANLIASFVFGASLFSACVLKPSSELKQNRPVFRVGPSISAIEIMDAILEITRSGDE